MEKSAPYSLNSLDYQKVLKDAAYFSIVPIIFYISAILTTIQQPGHVLSFLDFVPSNATNIAIVSWVLGQALNLLKKYIS